MIKYKFVQEKALEKEYKDSFIETYSIVSIG